MRRTSTLLLVLSTWITSTFPGRAAEPPPRVDRYGDPLPPRAMMRLGTVRCRHAGCASVAFTPDGKRLVTAGSGYVGFWDPATGRRVKQIPYNATCLALSPDGKKIALGGPHGDGSVCLLDVRKTKEVFSHRPKPDDGKVPGRQRDLVFSPDGTWFASADDQGVVRLWDTASGEEILVLRHGDERRKHEVSLAVSADAKRLASACEKNIRIWEIEQGGEPLLIEKAHDRAVNALAFSPDGRTLYSAGRRYELVRTEKDRYLKSHSQIRAWDTRTNRRIGEVGEEVEGEDVTGLALSPDGTSLLATFYPQTLRVFELPSGKPRFSIPLQGRMRSYNRGVLAVSPDGRTAAIAMKDSFQLWDLKTRTQRHVVPEAHVGMVRAATYAPDGRTVITGGGDGTVRIWDPRTGKQTRKLVYAPQTMNLMAVAVSPDGRVVAASGNYTRRPVTTVNAVKLWDVTSGKLLREIPLSACGYATAFSPDGKHVAVSTIGEPFGAGADAIHVMNVSTGNELKKLTGHKQTIVAVRFSADGRELVSVAQDKTIRVWDLATGKVKSNTKIEIENVTAAVVSHHAGTAVVADFFPPPGIAVLSIPGAKQLRRIDGARSGFGAHALDITADGQRLVAGCQENTIRVFALGTGKQQIVLASPDVKAFSMAFSPDGRHVITGMADGTVFIWDTSLDTGS